MPGRRARRPSGLRWGVHLVIVGSLTTLLIVIGIKDGKARTPAPAGGATQVGAAETYGRALQSAVVGAEGFADGVRGIEERALNGDLTEAVATEQGRAYQEAAARAAASVQRLHPPPSAVLSASYSIIAMQLYDAAASALASVTGDTQVKQAALDSLRLKELADRVFDRGQAALSTAEGAVPGTGVEVLVLPVPDFRGEAIGPPGWPGVAAEAPGRAGCRGWRQRF